MQRFTYMLLIVLVLCVLVAIPHAAAAAITVFTDRSTWETAVGNVFVTEDFNAVAPFDLPDGQSNVGLFDINVIGTANLGFPNSIIDPNLVVISLDIDGTTFFRGSSLTGSFPTLVFPNPIIGFGADWSSPTTAGMLTLDILGSIVEFDVHAPFGGFLGVVSDTPFTQVAMPTALETIEGYGMDNVSFTPEPTAFALATLGLLSLGFVAVRRRRRACPPCPPRESTTPLVARLAGE